MVWKPIRKRAHTQLVKEHSVSHLSSLNHCGLILTLRVELARANFHLKQRKKQTDKQKSAGGEWVVERSPQTFASDEKAATTMQHVTEQGMWVFFQK